MGLMDKVKAQATQLAQQTKDAAQEGKAKLDQAQASRRGDALLRNLGAAVYADRTGKGGPDSQSKIDQLVADISAHEAETGTSVGGQPQGPGAQPSFPPEPASSSLPDDGSGFAGSGTSTFPDASASSFPDSSASSFPDSSGSSFPDAGGAAFPDDGSGSGSQSGDATGFPSEG